jgi:ATP-dependent DNA helicase DinG
LGSLEEVFRPGGTLARAFEGFVSRPSQRRMAERIAQALEQREHLLVEAGTGTGKTFAYLVPVLSSGLRVLISTGTRTLQDQLYMRDIPLLAGALGRPLTTALLKGRANYLCLARLGGEAAQEALFAGEDAGLMRSVRDWAASTGSGDLAEVAALGESHPLRAQLTSTRESCLGVRCAEFSRCHVFAARRAALEADLVVVNHHLLLADLALKEDGFGELLPGVDALILDEAHQLPDLAAEFFGVSCSSRQVETLLMDARRELLAVAAPQRGLARLHALLEAPLRALAASLGRQERRVAWEELGAQVCEEFQALQAALESWARALEARSDAAGVAQCAARARALAGEMRQVIN